MEKRVVHTDKAASGKVPLSQAIQVGEWLHCSGQLPLDPATGELVPGGVAEQTRQIIENLKAVCEAGGTSLANAVKVTIFMEDLADLGGHERRIRGILRDGRSPGANDFPGGENHRGREARNRTARVHPKISAQYQEENLFWPREHPWSGY